MAAALTAHASGLDTLVVEKSSHFGGSTALSGGGIWVPGRARATPGGLHAGLPKASSSTCARSPTAWSARRGYGSTSSRRRRCSEFLEKLSGWFEFVWKPGYADYYPELPGGSELGSTINVPAHRSAQAGRRRGDSCCKPLALAPRGIWLGPKELRTFYRIRQSWAGKGVLVKLIWRMVRARVFGERMAAIGQSLAARLRLAMRETRHPAVAGRADGGAAHRRRRIGDRSGAGTRRRQAADRCAPRRHPGVRWLRSRPCLAQRAATGRGPGLELRQPGRHGRRYPRGPEGWRRNRPARRGLVVPGNPMAGRPNAIHAQRADDAVAIHRQRRRKALHQRGGARTWTSVTP